MWARDEGAWVAFLSTAPDNLHHGYISLRYNGEGSTNKGCHRPGGVHHPSFCHLANVSQACQVSKLDSLRKQGGHTPMSCMCHQVSRRHHDPPLSPQKGREPRKDCGVHDDLGLERERVRTVVAGSSSHYGWGGESGMDAQSV
jgi:hypothetical protein